MESKRICKLDFAVEDQDLMAPEMPNNRSSFSRKDVLKVICRVRPPFPQEQQGKFQIRKQECQLIVLDQNKNTQKTFSFNRVYDEQESQQQFVDQVCNSIIDKFNNRGKGSLIFSYGVTNSGKTYSILGNNQKPGILPHLIRHLKGDIRIYAFELYNDEFFDLKNRERINFKDHGSFFDFIDFHPQTIDQNNMETVLNTYMKNRTQGDSKANPFSSRSHAIFRIEFQGTVIGVVDLAGSERVNKTFGNADETSIINKSLLSLGRCIKAMKDKSTNNSVVIPYRQSKLTKVLYEFFAEGGQYGITMIANLSLASNVYHESLKVLEYAAIAHDIKYDRSKSPLSHKVVKSVQNQEFHKKKSQQEILKSAMKCAIQKANKEMSKAKSKRKKDNYVQVQKAKSVIQPSQKAIKKSYTQKQHSQKDSQEMDTEEYKMKIKFLNQELNRVNKINHLSKFRSRLKQSQQDFDIYFDFHFQKEKEKVNLALQELNRLPYYSPVIQRRNLKEMDNEGQAQPAPEPNFTQEQKHELQMICQKLQNSEKKLKDLTHIKQEREQMREMIEAQFREALQKQRQANQVDFGMNVGDSLKKMNVPDQPQVFAVKLEYEDAQMGTPLKSTIQVQKDGNESQKQQVAQKGVFSYLSYPISAVKKSAQKIQNAAISFVQNISSKKNKSNSQISSIRIKDKRSTFKKKKQSILLIENHQFFHGIIQKQTDLVNQKQINQIQVQTTRQTSLNFTLQFQIWNGYCKKQQINQENQTCVKQFNQFFVQTQAIQEQNVTEKKSLIEVSSDTEHQREDQLKPEKRRHKRNGSKKMNNHQRCKNPSKSHQKQNNKSKQVKQDRRVSKPAKSKKRPATPSPVKSVTPIKKRLRTRR